MHGIVSRFPFTAAILSAAVLGAAGTANAQSQEKCYGVAEAGQGDGIDRQEAAGSGQVDYQGNVWKMVPTGTCLTTALPPTSDGTPRRGSPEPLGRDRP